MTCLGNGKEPEGADCGMTPLSVSVDSVVGVAGLRGMAGLNVEEVLNVADVRVIKDPGSPGSYEELSHTLDSVRYSEMDLRVRLEGSGEVVRDQHGPLAVMHEDGCIVGNDAGRRIRA